MSTKQALALAPAALSGSDYLGKEGVFFARARGVRVGTSPTGLRFSVDGEVIGDEPTKLSVLPRALEVVVGPGYRMERGEGG